MSAESHAEHLDRNYRYQRHVYDASREYFLLGRKRLIADLAPPPGGGVLEVGCGTALNLMRASRRFPDARYFGIDLSGVMLETAGAAIARRGFSSRIKLARGDATDFDPEALLGCKQFDCIFFSYSLSMIPPWQTALEHAVRFLAPRGRLLIVDFGACEELPVWLKRVLYTWLAKFRVAPRVDLEPVLKALAAQHGLDLSFERVYRGYVCYAVLERR